MCAIKFTKHENEGMDGTKKVSKSHGKMHLAPNYTDVNDTRERECEREYAHSFTVFTIGFG